jgi:phosphomannomutase
MPFRLNMSLLKTPILIALLLGRNSKLWCNPPISFLRYRADGNWVLFTGDQLGSLFAHQAFEAYKLSGKPLGLSQIFDYKKWCSFDVDRLAMVASTVSSKMVEAMAHKEGFEFADCLTGEFP